MSTHVLAPTWWCSRYCSGCNKSISVVPPFRCNFCRWESSCCARFSKNCNLNFDKINCAKRHFSLSRLLFIEFIALVPFLRWCILFFFFWFTLFQQFNSFIGISVYSWDAFLSHWESLLFSCLLFGCVPDGYYYHYYSVFCIVLFLLCSHVPAHSSHWRYRGTWLNWRHGPKSSAWNERGRRAAKTRRPVWNTNI